jgi:UDP-3-O-[3-hydroxymyristoyl] glucosamine N-acyltransferase
LNVKNPYIDPTAHVSAKEKIGKNTRICINVQIREDAEIGEDFVIGKDVNIDHGVKISEIGSKFKTAYRYSRWLR